MSSDVSYDADCELGVREVIDSVECPESMKYCTYSKTEWTNIGTKFGFLTF